MTKLVTIAIPVYNSEQYIVRCINSVLYQSYGDIEVLIMNDKSTDNTIDLINQLAAQNNTTKTIRIIENEENMGVAYTRDRVFHEANSKYLFFLDSDDYLEKDAIKILVDSISENDSNIAIGSYYIVSEDEKRIKEHKIQSYRSNTQYEFGSLRFGSMRGELESYMWNVLYDLDYVKSLHIQIMNITSYEDVYFWFRLIPHIQSFVLIPNFTYNYTIRQSSLSDYRNQGTISNNIILNHIAVRTYEMNHLRDYIKLPYIGDMCESILHTNIYCILSILRNKHRIQPKIDYSLLKPLLHLDFHLTEVLKIKKKRWKIFAFYLFSKLHYLIQIRLIRMLQK